MKILIHSVGKTRDKRLKGLADEYLKRIKHYLPVDTQEVKEGTGRADEVKSQEAQNLVNGLADDTILVVLDEHGESLTSRKFADFIESHMIRGTRYLAFLIGGAAGLDPELLKRADYKISLSTMTLPHELARVILLEQSYRAMTIIRGEPYHKD